MNIDRTLSTKSMDEKKILIVSSSFYPMNSPRSFRTTELVKEFAREGHDVTLLTLKNDEVHRKFEKDYGVTIKDMGPLQLPELKITKKSGAAVLLKRILRRGLLLFFEYPDIELMYRVKRALKKESGYDLLISIAVPHPIHWGVAWAQKGNRSIAETWVADCGDPYMGAAMDSFKKMFYFKYPEKKFCRKADFITVPLEDAKKGYYPEFRQKIRIVPQGFNFDEIKIDQASYVPNSVPTFAYSGGLIPGGRDPRNFLEYLVGLNRDYKFIFYTRNKSLVEPWLSKGAGRIEIRDYLPRKMLLKRLSKMDFLVNFENRSPLQMPSKLIDYYLTGRPVLNISSTAIDSDQITNFLDGDYREQYNYGDMNIYRIENVCSRFLDLSKKRELKDEPAE